MNSNRLNRSWKLKRRPEGVINEKDLELVSEEVPQITDGQVLAKTIYFSLDPTNNAAVAGRLKNMLNSKALF